MSTIEEMIKSLPPELQKEARDFVEYLSHKHRHKQQDKLSLNWVGDLKKYRDKYTSLELEEKASDWWGE